MKSLTEFLKESMIQDAVPICPAIQYNRRIIPLLESISKLSKQQPKTYSLFREISKDPSILKDHKKSSD